MELAGCDGDPNAAYGDDVITICYEYIEELWKNAPSQTTPEGVAPIDAIVGPLFDTILHEFGHALFDMLNLPVLGREEDAADQVAAYIYLHLGEAEARRMVLGTAYNYRTEAKADGKSADLKRFSDAHGTPAQRLYNLLCVAYGANPKAFGDLVTKGYLPKERADDCEDEYNQVAHAFDTLIGPHIDRRLAKQVLDKNWLPDQTRPTPRPAARAAPAASKR